MLNGKMKDNTVTESVDLRGKASVPENAKHLK